MAGVIGGRYLQRMSRIVDWNGKDVPEGLRELPAGRYVLESVDEAPELTQEQEEGLRMALASLEAGEGQGLEEVRRHLTGILSR